MVEFKLENPDKHDKKREELYSKVLSLKDVVAYQEGTVASRMLVNKPAGTITLFAFDAGEGLSEHTAPYDAIVTIIDGEAEITIAGREFHLRKGQMIIMPAHVPHAVRAVQRFRMMLVMIHA